MVFSFRTFLIATGIVVGAANLSPAAAQPPERALIDISPNALTIQLNKSERQKLYRQHSERYGHRNNHHRPQQRHHRKRPSEFTDPDRRNRSDYRDHREHRHHKRWQDERREEHRDWRRDWFTEEFDRPRRRYGDRRAGCTPTKALRKVQRRGLRRAHVRRVNRRGVVIAGRKRGERIIIGFGRHPSCPVRFIRTPGH